MLLMRRATRLQRRHRAFLGTLALAQARARPNIVVSPADGQRVVALDVRRGYDDVWPGARLSEGERAEEGAVAPL